VHCMVRGSRSQGGGQTKTGEGVERINKDLSAR